MDKKNGHLKSQICFLFSVFLGGFSHVRKSRPFLFSHYILALKPIILNGLTPEVQMSEINAILLTLFPSDYVRTPLQSSSSSGETTWAPNKPLASKILSRIPLIHFLGGDFFSSDLLTFCIPPLFFILSVLVADSKPTFKRQSTASTVSGELPAIMSISA